VPSKELVLHDWVPPPVSSIFSENIGRLYAACQKAHENKLEAQYIFSHMIRGEEWQDARGWYDPRTGGRWDNECDIPNEAKSTVSSYHKFLTQKEFLEWCEENLPSFRKSTFWERHSIIDKLTETGVEFADAVMWVVGLGVWGLWEEFLAVLEFDDDRHIIGYKEEPAKRLGELLQDEDLPVVLEDITVSPSDKVDAVKNGLVQATTEAALTIGEGRNNAVGIKRDVRRIVFNKPNVRIVHPPNDKFTYAIEATFGDGTRYGTSERIFYIQFVDEVSGEILTDLPSEVKSWWLKKANLKS
jgi:hypothetical protein